MHVCMLAFEMNEVGMAKDLTSYVYHMKYATTSNKQWSQSIQIPHPWGQILH